MGIGGGIAGAVIGGLAGGPWGAVIGGIIGAAVTGSSKHPEEPQQTEEPDHSTEGHPAQTVEAFAKLFRCYGKLAKADGHVSTDEASFVSEILKKMDLPMEARTAMKQAFDEGRDTSRSFRNLVIDLSREPFIADDPNFRRSVVSTFCILAAADNEVVAAERDMLREAGEILGCRPVVDEFFRSRPEFHEKASPQEEPDDSLNACYRTLGISSSADVSEIKRAWRAKIMEFHPDHIQGKGLSADFIEFAKQKTQAVNEAYETIRRSRGF